MDKQPLHFRIFISSPGDVSDERGIAFTIIKSLQENPAFIGRITTQPVAWDTPGAHLPMEADLPPQESVNQAMPRPAVCDIVIVILWARMGTPLTDKYKRADGSSYLSGTEWEYEDAINAAREAEKAGQPRKPRVFLYHRTDEPPSISLTDPKRGEKIQQWERVQTFFEQFKDASGALTSGITTYDKPDDFRDKLEQHLIRLVANRLDEQRDSAPTKATPMSVAAPSGWPKNKSPFPGLRTFTDEDAPIYFGRGRDTDALLEKVRNSRFVTVVGASGSGKSSLVWAGLIPRLKANALADSHSEHWRWVRFTPGATKSGDPFEALANALIPHVRGWEPLKLTNYLAADVTNISKIAESIVGGEAGELLLFIDQFEELYTIVPTEPNDLRQRFTTMLQHVTQSERVRVVATIRADFYQSALADPMMETLLREGTFPLSQPSGFALLQMIERPAVLAGLQFEDDLPERIIEDTGNNPGSLALVAYLLDELYHARDKSNKLTKAAYEHLEGVQGAIGKRSEMTFAALDQAAQERLPHVFRELVKVDERGTATRKRSLRQDMAWDEASTRLVNAFIKARLFVSSKDATDRPVIEVAHEALLTSWERLKVWIAEHQNHLRMIERAMQAAQEWENSGRPAFLLWSHEQQEPLFEALKELDINIGDNSIFQAWSRPEVERLLDEFKSINSQEYDQLSIVKRWRKLGVESVGLLVRALAYARSAIVRTTIYHALWPHRSFALIHLITLLKSNNPDERLATVNALEKLGDASAAPVLLDTLHDAYSTVRSAAARGLGILGDASAVPALLKALHDKDDDVRSAAARGLGILGDASAVPALFEILFDLDEDWQMRVHNDEIEQIEMRSDEDWQVRSAAILALGNIGNVSVVPVWLWIRALFLDFDEDWQMRILINAESRVYSAAVSVLGNIGDAHAVFFLRQVLRRGNVMLRSAAVSALVSIGNASVVTALLEALHERSGHISSMARVALEKLNDARAVPILMEALDESDRDISNMHVLLALEKLSDVSTVPVLLEVFHDNDAKVRSGEATALRTVTDITTVPALLEALHDIQVRNMAAARLRVIGDARAVPALLEALHDNNNYVRITAMFTLWLVGDARAVPALLETLHDTWAEVRWAAAAALRVIGDARAVPALLGALHDTDAKVRRATAAALGNISDATTVPALLEALHDTDAEVRRTTAAALEKLSDATTAPALLEALHDTDAEVRSMAAAVLGKVADATTVPALLEALHDTDAEVRSMAAAALGSIGNTSAIPALATTLFDSSPKVQIQASGTLALLGDSRGVPILVLGQRDDDEDIRNAATELLKKVEYKRGSSITLT